MLSKREKEHIRYIWVLKRKYENIISDAIYNKMRFEIAYGKYKLCKQLIKDYTEILRYLEEDKRYYYEFCEKYNLKAIR